MNNDISAIQTRRLYNHEVEWHTKFNELCYKLFHQDKLGAEFLKHIEEKYFRQSVAYPGTDISWAYYNEGRNDFIRSLSNAMQSHINASNSKNIESLKHKTKAI